MHLKSFHVRLFRNIIDSGPIQVDKTTCLVGKNEAGKSSIIEALHRLNPAKPVPLDLLDDYPRWLKKLHEIEGTIDNAVPITATFSLSDDEFASIETQFGQGVLTSRDFEASRKYKGEMTLSTPIAYRKFVSDFCGAHVAEILKPKVSSAHSSTTLIEALNAAAAEVDADKEPTPEAKAAKQSRAALDKVLGVSSGLRAAIEGLIAPLIPKTFYFGNYSQLLGRYNLREVLPALTTPSADEEIQAAADFLKLARISPTNVETWDFEQSNSELEAISSLLTQRVKSNWKQNQHLKLVVKIEIVQTGRNMEVERYLQFRVDDTRHDFSSRLDRRSTGFRWFVSFIASFFEFEGNKNIILLLDEPGLSLHARAQKDLLDSIDTNLTKGRQVIYTTHSPFMVRTESLNRVRIVEDQGPELGATVTNEAGMISDPDTLFPLQAALGYDIAQNLFIGNRNILCEGTSDFIYLKLLSAHFSTLGRSTIPANCRILPAGGATNIPTFIALLGGKLDLVVLLDGKAQRQRIDNAIAAGRLKASNVLSVDQFCNVKGADIEDLFSVDEYLLLYNATFGRSVTAGELSGRDRITKRLERLHGEFDHGVVAGYLLMHQGEFMPKLSLETSSRFERVIQALVAALPPAATDA